jgi:hypothetical protein
MDKVEMRGRPIAPVASATKILIANSLKFEAFTELDESVKPCLCGFS